MLRGHRRLEGWRNASVTLTTVGLQRAVQARAGVLWVQTPPGLAMMEFTWQSPISGTPGVLAQPGDQGWTEP